MFHPASAEEITALIADLYQIASTSLEELSSRFFINKYYMVKLFTEAYGTSIRVYVNALRVTKAKQLLRFSDMRMEEIGCEVGFEDPNYFSRMFKKVEGMSPSEYRKLW